MRVTTQKHFVLRRCYQLAWWRQRFILSDTNRRALPIARGFPLEHPIREASCGAQWIPWRQKKMSETCQSSDEIRWTRSSGNRGEDTSPVESSLRTFHLKVTCSPTQARKITSIVTSSSFMILGTCTHTANPKRVREPSERRKIRKIFVAFQLHTVVFRWRNVKWK